MYNDSGIRTQKTVNGVATDYFLDGSSIIAEKTGNNTTWYYYDGDGTREAIEYKGNVYYYFYNAQGDVMGLYDNNLNVVVNYTYDSWGNTVSITGSLASTLGQDNPFRYRGYYFDSDTGLYYLNSRYYDANTGRFVNADGMVSTGQGILDKNMFAYCENNPVNRVDEGGNCWKDVKNWFSEKWNSTKKSLVSLKNKVTYPFKKLPYNTVEEAALASGINLNNLTQQDNNEHGQGIVYNKLTKTYGLTDVIDGTHSSVSFSNILNNNRIVAVVHSHPNCNGHIGNEFSDIISDASGNISGDWAVATSNKIDVYLAAPNGNLYVMYWDVGEYNQELVCDGLPIDDSQFVCR